jgi:RNA polymerase sigma-70 factor (ECF subfamily)
MISTESIGEDEGYRPAEGLYGALESVSRGDRAIFVKKALEMLNEEDSLLINLYYWQDNSMAEVATVTGLDENLVKVKIHRARQKLQKNLSESLGVKMEDLL